MQNRKNIDDFLFANFLKFYKNIAKTNNWSTFIFLKKKLKSYYMQKKEKIMLGLKLQLGIHIFTKKNVSSNRLFF